MNHLFLTAIVAALLQGNPTIMAAAALALFPLRRRSCPGLLFIASGSLMMLLASGMTSAELFFLRGVLCSLASTAVDAPPGFAREIIEEMRALRGRMSTLPPREKLALLRDQFPRLPARSIHPVAELLAWTLIVAPIAAGFVSRGHASTPAEFIADTPRGVVVLHEGANDLAGSHGRVVVEVFGATARVVDADCPQRRCVAQGSIRAGDGRAIVCMPNRVVIRSRTKARVDGWTG